MFHHLPTVRFPWMRYQRLDFQIDNLNLPGVPPLSALSGHLASDPGRLLIEPLTVSVASGEIKARLDVASPVKAVLNIDAQGLSVEALETHLRGTRFFRGGRADLKANLQLSGSTPRKMFASPNGAVILSVSHAHLSGSAAAVDQGILTTLLQALIPGRPIKQEMNIQCAVLRLPVAKLIWQRRLWFWHSSRRPRAAWSSVSPVWPRWLC